MDILLISTAETADCIIINPRDGQPTDITITVSGVDSHKFRALAKAEAKNRLLAKADGIDVNEETVESDAKFLSELTVGWKNVEIGGKKLEFSTANAIKVYTLSAPIRNQINAFISRTTNFLPKA